MTHPLDGIVDRAARIRIGRKTYRKHILYPGPVRDGTCRCIACGQIDEPDFHDGDLCARVSHAFSKAKS